MKAPLKQSAALLAASLLPFSVANAAPEHSVTTVFRSGTEGYHTFRIPALVCTNDGTLLAFCEGRKTSSSDAGDIDIVLKRSTDHGASWEPLRLVQEEGENASITIGNPVPIVDRTTGHIHLLFTRENDTVFHTVSTDNGLTWAPRKEITANVKLPDWGWYATGPCHGIQLTRGNQAGRLVAPANHRIGTDGSDSGAFGAQILYSDDHGATWQMDTYASAANGTAPNETTLVELNTPGTPAASRTTANSPDVPKIIEAADANRVVSALTTNGISGSITDVNVSLDISHTYTSDLTIHLVHPDGTRILLSERNGGNGDNFTGTTFDQQAPTPITAASAPFTGTFSPQGDLGGLNTKSPNGTWSLDVTDNLPQDGGAINSWSLEISTNHQTDGIGSHIYINSRDYGSAAGNRSEAYSGDGGSSYSIPYRGNSHFVTPICQGSLVRFSATDAGDSTNRLIFSAPNGGSRSNGSLWVSTDETVSWSEPKLLLEGAYAYSDMARTGDGQLGVFAETDSYGAIKFIKVNEEWLDQQPPAPENPSGAFWNFEENQPGQNAATTPNAIPDIGIENNQRHLTADAAFAYIPGSPSYPASTALSFANNGGLKISDSLTDNNFDFGANDSFTLEAAFRIPRGTLQTGAIAAKDLGGNQPSWWLRVENGGNLRFLVSDNTREAIASTGTITVNDGEWHTVAAVKDAAARRLRIYLDGTLAADVQDTTTGSHANNQALCIGRFNATGRDFTGDIDFVRITPAALPPSQFVQTYTQLDADGDNIPDDYERTATGNTSTLGAGDSDHDGSSDPLEFAAGSSPTDGKSTPHTTIQSSPDGQIAFTFIQRELPPWLTLTAEFSNNLKSWSPTLSGATITPATAPSGTGLTKHTYTITPHDSPLPAVFSRLSVESSQ